jgi:hypothetical protein
MHRYSVNSEVVTSATADTDSFPLDIVTGTTKVLAVYEMIFALKVAASDTRHIAELSGVTALTAGTGLTPEPLTLGDPASIFTCSTTPTAVTKRTNPMFRVTFNGRATVRWAAVDPDSRLFAPAGAGVAGTIVVINRNSTAAAVATENELFVVE